MKRITLALGLVLLAFGLTACGISADYGAASGLLGLVLLVVPFASSARAGPPMPCEGYETTSCENGWVRTHCCPKNAKCNFDFPSFISCGNQTCVVGADAGRCPAPLPMVDPSKKSAADCGYGWEDACVARKVTKACIMPVPTNYSGPDRNPPYRTCGDDRCTTHSFLEDCFPTKEELGSKACKGGWTKVCLGGKVHERCLPNSPMTPLIPNTPSDTFRATEFTLCPDTSCVVGSDAKICPQ